MLSGHRQQASRGGVSAPWGRLAGLALLPTGKDGAGESSYRRLLPSRAQGSAITPAITTMVAHSARRPMALACRRWACSSAASVTVSMPRSKLRTPRAAKPTHVFSRAWSKLVRPSHTGTASGSRSARSSPSSRIHTTAATVTTRHSPAKIQRLSCSRGPRLGTQGAGWITARKSLTPQEPSSTRCPYCARIGVL